MEKEKLSSKLLNFVFVMCGGLLGSLSRYAISLVVPKNICAVSLVNILGSFLVIWFNNKLMPKKKRLKLFAITGYLGSFTTFSYFSLETMQFLNSGQYATFAFNIILNMLGSLTSAFVGWKLFTDSENLFF
ncbi:fluoride ion transporter crcb-related [Anaeramoeba flamelloides]|uniref:Fluoride ion transporter crcb-related n=1 Tax=Anaeramoeba flamelloides TaxID=1746091 RepID=A0AAV8AF87_9EUKA|nr:fluoride ion transporter crcb-related [Anaeramoeba flamelloides]KAJ6249570.1 fluoride ion transporter crcb-related [Anaeramoeba flamelloides]